jgi:hypothetical protein
MITIRSWDIGVIVFVTICKEKPWADFVTLLQIKQQWDWTKSYHNL